MPLTIPPNSVALPDLARGPATSRLQKLRWGVAGFIGLYILAAQAVLLWAPARAARADEWFSLWLRLAPVVILPLLLAAVVHGRHTVRDAQGRWVPFPAGWLEGWRKARRTHLSNATLARIAVLAMVVPAFHRAFTVMKSSMVLLVPFWADPYLLRLERFLHGGLPQSYLAPWLAHDGFIITADRLYFLWHYILLATVFWVAMQSDPAYRLRALLAFVATWVLLGNVLACLLDSAGPWAYGAVTGLPSPYTGLLARLREANTTAPVFALVTEERLWSLYRAGRIGLGAGISAMPSLHVAMPVLGAFIAYPRSKVMAGLLGTYALIIMVSSVALAWHYAIDGYLSLLLVPLIWAGAGRIVRWAEIRDGSLRTGP